ncbi:MAG: polysaccharide pyruvyl transferase family protein [Blautia sp.]|uniref:polysaccharide pyruvyl transferase family protein n=1 Tax=Blautia sp. TaxID=1955243 RepID=UPI003990FC6E
MNIIFYSHGGSYNHGCEAIIRGTVSILGKQDYTLYSLRKQEDEENGLNEIVNIQEDSCDIKKNPLRYLMYCIKYKITHNDMLYYQEQHRDLYKKSNKNGIAFSVGGDNYCYEGLPERMAEYNIGFNKSGIKTVLWGCSIEPDLLKSEQIKNDLKKYRLIVARESITYNALKEHGIDQTVLYPDPAFALEKDDTIMLPPDFGKNGIVGINISPLVEDIAGDIVFQNYCNLIEYILENTKLDIMLVPHVVWADLDDRKSIEKIYKHFGKSARILTIEDNNCCKLKGYIGKCDFFIGARTHSTIAAYSQKIPTLVVGYSVKSKGIAKDLFDTYDNYVIPVQAMREKDQLTKAFKWLVSNQSDIVEILEEKIPVYQHKLLQLKKIIEGMV